MLAQAGPLPDERDDAAHAYELKWDGVRALAYVRGGALTLLSRNGRDITAAYPELQELCDVLGDVAAVLDGEIVALGPGGTPDFGLLQRRMHVADGASIRRLARELPVNYLAFDVLHLRATSTVSAPYDDRRGLLDGLALEGVHVAAPPALHVPGPEAVEISQAHALEGIVAKRRDSSYEPGRRSGRWRKIKNIAMAEVVIGGWKSGSGRRSHTIGSLLLGVPDGSGGLRYAGHVGTGFTEALLDHLTALLTGLQRPTSPFADEVPRLHARDAHWTEPVIVGEVAYTNWTRDGRLRHPSWRGLRPDKDVADLAADGITG
jgi:bifunctional non-homologous end joining protein LigD